jgi:hypothetical protein
MEKAPECIHVQRGELRAIGKLTLEQSEDFVLAIPPLNVRVCALCVGWMTAVTTFGLPTGRGGNG